MANDNDTLADIVAEMRKANTQPDYYQRVIDGYADRIEAAAKRGRRLLKSCARWILCHDIYGHIAKELLDECKGVLHDDGQFLFKEGEQ